MSPDRYQHWAETWEEWAATFSQFTRVERQAFYRTLCAIRALPEVER